MTTWVQWNTNCFNCLACFLHASERCACKLCLLDIWYHSTRQSYMHGKKSRVVILFQLDDWTTQSLLTNRTVKIGRFTVTTTTAQEETSRNTTPVPPLQPSSNEEASPKGSPKKSRRFSFYPEGSPRRLRRILSRKNERNAEGT